MSWVPVWSIIIYLSIDITYVLVMGGSLQILLDVCLILPYTLYRVCLGYFICLLLSNIHVIIYGVLHWPPNHEEIE